MNIRRLAASALTFLIAAGALTVSPIKGPAGNIEYLAYFSDFDEKKSDFNIDETVENAFITLSNKD